jgi:hypothetical protein
MNEEPIRFGAPTPDSPADDVPVRVDSEMDRLKARLTAKTEKPVQRLDCAHKPGIVLVFNPVLSGEQMQQFEKKCTTRVGKNDELDVLRMSAMIIGALVTDIESDEGVSFGGGFNTNDVMDLFDAKSVIQAVRAFYGHGDDDAAMTTDAATMTTAAGWGRDGTAPR